MVKVHNTQLLTTKSFKSNDVAPVFVVYVVTFPLSCREVVVVQTEPFWQ